MNREGALPLLLAYLEDHADALARRLRLDLANPEKLLYDKKTAVLFIARQGALANLDQVIRAITRHAVRKTDETPAARAGAV